MSCRECGFYELYRPFECGLARFNWLHNSDQDCPAEEDAGPDLEGDSAEDRCLGDIGI